MPSPTLTPEDLATIRVVTDPQVSDDGTIRAAVVHAPAPARGESPRSEIRVARGDEAARPVTSGPGVDLTPRISPTGRRLAFASDRERPGLWRLYAVPLDDTGSSAEPRKFAALPGVVEDIAWAEDESALLVCTADDGSDTGNARGGTRFVPADEEEAPWTVRRPATGWRRLYRVDLASGAAVQVSPDGLTVWEFGWAGHGPVAAVVSADPGESGWYDAELAVMDIESRTARTVHTPTYQLQSPVVSEDARTLAFIEAPQSDRALLAGDIVVLDLETGSIVRPRHEADVARLRWTRDGRLFWVGVASVETACGFLRRDADAWRVDECWRGRATLGRAYQVRADCSRGGGTIVAVRQGHDQPPELQELKVPAADRPDTEPSAAGWRPLTEVNAALAGRAPARETVHRWKAVDGTEIHGLLLLPTDRTASALPLVVVAHGGPTNAVTSIYAQGAHRGDALLLAQAGCAVLLPNPRGSIGRGREFMAANIGDLGGGDLADLEAGVASLVATGLVDPGRVGITGLSYGGFMSAWAAVRSEVFAASVPISGLMNWLSFHNTSNVGRFDEIFLDGDPYDPAGPYLDRSPVMYVRECRTPTLLLHGDLDLACPLGQAQEFYQGLAAAGCETELVAYKGAGHGMSEREHVIDVSRRIIGWFTRHLNLDTTH
ncbi:S9 family peptidase [Streptomyces malaysiensis]|uniref:S9 family peptidase n=1 Tax=Streptomyces malaysiensis subsp. samsunensis TaxID=459658 RepID=A0A9X2M5V6_STRMQ|nr:S9 family peptidase [Streptomyces samsunensis]MCQ8835596.1 S9 family peptidase [Streptomyces samsunensis]